MDENEKQNSRHLYAWLRLIWKAHISSEKLLRFSRSVSRISVRVRRTIPRTAIFIMDLSDRLRSRDGIFSENGAQAGFLKRQSKQLPICRIRCW